MTKGKAVRRAAAFGGIAATIGVTVWAAACLDLTPVTADEVVTFRIPIPDVQRPPVPDGAARGDASADGEDGAMADAGVDVYVPPCQACVESPDTPGPGCATEVEACLANAQCAEAYACVLQMGCLLLQSRENLLICATPCVTEAGGITSQTSVAGMLVAAVAQCIVGPCGGVCAPTE